MLLFRLLTYPSLFRSKCPQFFLYCFLLCAQPLHDSSHLFLFGVLNQVKVRSLYLQSLSKHIFPIPTSWISDISLFLATFLHFTLHSAHFSLSQTDFKIHFFQGNLHEVMCVLSVFSPNPLLGFALHCGCKDLLILLLLQTAEPTWLCK